MTRDLTTEGPVPGQERIDVRNEPCSRWCPFQPCPTCPYKGGTWGSEDEQPEPKPTREEPERGEDARHQTQCSSDS